MIDAEVKRPDKGVGTWHLALRAVAEKDAVVGYDEKKTPKRLVIPTAMSS